VEMAPMNCSDGVYLSAGRQSLAMPRSTVPEPSALIASDQMPDALAEI
jgi:hypothetical protein